jgi:hypothetical protein
MTSFANSLAARSQDLVDIFAQSRSPQEAVADTH